MNNLKKILALDNRYYVMRHGHSAANDAGIIVSDPAHGIRGYGLSGRGREQVAQAVFAAGFLDPKTLIVSSDFKRAEETAEIAWAILGCEKPVILDPRLRERNFGELELGPDDQYSTVWRKDKEDPNHTSGGVESASAVMERSTALVAELEVTSSNSVYLLVSHGDPLQVLQSAFQRQPASCHRDMKPIQTAEIRSLELVARKDLQ